MSAVNSSQDGDLLRRLAAGDEQAFTALYRAYQGAVYRFAIQMSGNAQIAEDVTQEVFLILMRKAAEFDAARGRLSSWLYGIARNQVLRQLEARGEPVELAGGEEDSEAGVPPQLVASFDPIEAMTARQRAEALREAILSLPPRYREVVVLCELHEMSYAEAAAVTGCAVGTIRSRLHRSRALLHSKLAARRTHAASKVSHRRSA
jgi:RNA polymerase sigma-70 factor (ECF subfamily)